jgi:hypothetical protein
MGILRLLLGSRTKRGSRKITFPDDVAQVIRASYKAIASADDELVTLCRLLDPSLNARAFVRAAMRRGFKLVEEGWMGLKMESPRGAFMLGVFRSVHRSKIATLVYLNKASNETVTLVDGAEREYPLFMP